MKPLRISSPCDERWSAMERVGSARHCARCDKQVHDLTRMTEVRAHAHALLFGGRGLCARMRTDEHGFGVFREPSKPVGRATLPGVATMLALGSGCSSNGPAHAEAVECAPTAHIVDIAVPPAGSIARSAPVPTVRHASDGDADGDGVADGADVCPTVAAPEAADGCPAVRRVIVTSAGDMAILQKVEFVIGKAVMTGHARAIVDETAKLLAGHPEIVHLVVEGHADASEKNPDALALSRARAVVTQLVNRGVDPNRVEARSAGATKPIESNATAEGRAKNRRIDFLIQ